MFTGHDRPAAMYVYWSVAIFTSDRISRPVGSFLHEKVLLAIIKLLVSDLTSLLKMCYFPNPAPWNLYC